MLLQGLCCTEEWRQSVASWRLPRPSAGLLIVQAVKAGEGRAEMELRAVEPVAKVTAPVSPECKL